MEVAPTCNLTKQLIFVDSPCATDYVRLGNDKFHPSLLYKLKGPPVLLHEASFVGCYVFCRDPFSLTTSAFCHSKAYVLVFCCKIKLQMMKEISSSHSTIVSEKKSCETSQGVGRKFGLGARDQRYHH